MAVQDPPEPQQPPSTPVQKILKAAAAGEAAKIAVGATVVAPAVTVTLPAQAAAAVAKVPVGIAVGGLKFAIALRVLRALFRRHHAQSADWLTKQLTSRYPNATDQAIREAVARELQYEIAFQRKALARVQDDLNAAAKLSDDKQQARINAILQREIHYSNLRQQAMITRATAYVQNAVVKQRSPQGATWMLGPAKNHTRGCVALAGKAWPWSVLDAIQPPLHTGCGCWLKPLGPGDTVPEPGEALRAARAALALEEAIRAVADPGEIEMFLSGLEVRPSVARAISLLQETTVYDEILHPRGRGGEWIKKLGISHVISIDGPAASGKSTVARKLAERLGGTYIDTGAHYRAAGLAKTRGIDPVTALRAGRIRAEGSKVELDGRDVSQAIRTPEVDRAASQLGSDQNVRSAIDSTIQQRVAEGGLFIADGRDAGNALNAHDRIFLTSDPQVRAQRRAEARGLTVPEAHAAITERDTLDAPRIAAARAGASHVIDSSNDTSAQTVQRIIDAVASEHLTNSSPQPAVLPDDWPEKGLAWQARWDALPDDTPVWVFHSTDQQTAEKLQADGIDPVNKPTNLNRQRYEAGDMEGVFFQPGAGLAAGLPVALQPGQTGGYGRQLLAVKVRKGDIQVSPEQAALGETQPGGALRVGDAVTSAVIAPQDVVAVGQPGRDPSAVDITGQLRERGLLQEAFDESLHPRDRYGKWSFLGRLHTLSRSEIEGGRVPGLQVGGLAAGVAGHAGLGGRPITLAPSSFSKEGLVSSVLVAHEAGHHLTSTVIKDGKIPDELKAFDVGPGRPAGRYGAVAGNVSHLFANPWKGDEGDLPEEMIADGYADLLHGGAEFRYDGPPEPEPGTDEHKSWAADVAKDRAAFESNPKFKLLGVIAKAAREHGMPDKALYRFESSKVGNEWQYKLALRESFFDTVLHPRGRRGQWIDAIERAEPHHEGFTGQDFANAMDGFQHGGIVAVRSSRTKTQNQYGEVWLNLQKVGEVQPVGLARVTIKPPNLRGERHAELSNIYLRGSEQGNGFGAAFTNHFLDTLRNNGVDRVDVEAVSVGGYAWARRGFVWTGDKGAVQRQILADAQKDGRWNQIADHVSEQTMAELQRKLDAGEFTSEAELAGWGLDNWWYETPPERHDYSTGQGPPKIRNWPGKELMIGSHWKGELDLQRP